MFLNVQIFYVLRKVFTWFMLTFEEYSILSLKIISDTKQTFFIINNFIHVYMFPEYTSL